MCALLPACVCSVNVCTHSALEKSHSFTVVSPLTVARRAPLFTHKENNWTLTQTKLKLLQYPLQIIASAAKKMWHLLNVKYSYNIRFMRNQKTLKIEMQLNCMFIASHGWELTMGGSRTQTPSRYAPPPSWLCHHLAPPTSSMYGHHWRWPGSVCADGGPVWHSQSHILGITMLCQSHIDLLHS